MQKKTVVIEYANTPLIVSGDFWPAMPSYKPMFEVESATTPEGSDLTQMIEAIGDWDEVQRLCIDAVLAAQEPHREAA